jgi:Na+/proline symporter
MQETEFFQLSATTAILLLAGFYGATFLMSLLIGEKNENVDGYMVSNNAVGFGLSTASMIATWIWAASFYASATSGYKYGLSGPLHYGFWGALMILFIYPFGKRFRQLAPKAHTLAEVIHARHGTSSQMIMAVSNIVGSCISLMVNFTAAGALVSILSPLSFIQGVLIAGLGVLSYTLWSGFRTSVMTDFAQLAAMIIAAVIIIPLIFFNAIGNQTIAQRLFAVREDLIKPTFLTATAGYGAVVIGLGMLGLLALFVGLEPANGDMNNIIPQMASTYLPPFGIALFFLLVVGSLSSTADSDLAALSAIVMTDIYAKNLSRGRPDPRRMLWWGRVTMIVATMVGVIFASLRLDILVMLVFVGALWGAIVFPVIASFYWDRVDNRAFVWSVLSAVALFAVARFELIPIQGAVAVFFEICAAIGGGVVLGLMTFGFFGRKAALAVGAAGMAVMLPAFVGTLREYIVLMGSLTAYGVSAAVCAGLSLRNTRRFDFSVLADRVTSFHREQDAQAAAPAQGAAIQPAKG